MRDRSGNWRELSPREPAGFVFEIKSLPVGGYVLVCPRDLRHLRWKRFVIFLAGPAVNLSFLAVALHFSPRDQLFFPEIFTDRGGSPMIALLGQANLLILIASLFPCMIKIDYGTHSQATPSDGLALLTTPFLSRKVMEQQHAAYFAMEALECYQQKEYQTAKQWCSKALDLYENDVPSRMMLASVNHFMRDHQGARAEWLRMLHQADLPEEMRPVLLNNIAWVNLVIGGSELLEESDSFSLQALQCRQDYLAFKGTRGSVLIERGDIAEGLPLVQAAFAGNEDKRLKALNSCYIALGESKRGNSKEALQARKDAHALDPDCILLEKVDQQLTARS